MIKILLLLFNIIIMNEHKLQKLTPIAISFISFSTTYLSLPPSLRFTYSPSASKYANHIQILSLISPPPNYFPNTSFESIPEKLTPLALLVLGR